MPAHSPRPATRPGPSNLETLRIRRRLESAHRLGQSRCHWHRRRDHRAHGRQHAGSVGVEKHDAGCCPETRFGTCRIDDARISIQGLKPFGHRPACLQHAHYFPINRRTSAVLKARLKTATSSNRPSHPASWSLRPPKNSSLETPPPKGAIVDKSNSPSR